MKSEWKNCTLNDIGTIQTGKTPPAKVENAYGDGLPFITPRDMDERKFIRSTERHLTENGVNSIKNYVIPEYSVSVSCIGSDMGKVIMTDKPSVTNQQINSIIVNTTEYFPEYIYYNLSSKRKELRNMAGGTTMPIINKTDFSKINIQIPPLSTQKKIAHILSTLDDKIELNRKMNATLEAMAQAMFKSWFVDFDPVYAKAQAKSEAELEAAAAELGISREILDLFPSAFVESEMGMIPAGWEVKPLIELINIVGGGTPKRSVDKFWDGIVPWFSVKDTPRVGDIFVIDTVEKITELGLSKSSAKLLPAGTTIITARGTVGNLALTAMPTSINQSCYGIKGKTLGELYTYFLMSSVVNDLKKNVHGAVFDTITTNTFSTISVVVPSEDLHMRFDRTVLPLLERIKSNLFEIQTLQKTRDTLLPKLLSGELDVSKIETEM